MIDLVWVASKIRQFLQSSPYIFDFADYESFPRPIIAFREFIISVESENSITLGIQPGMSNVNVNELKEKLGYMVDEINLRYL